MATIRKRLGKIHMFTYGRDFGIPKYLAEKGMDVNIEYVRNGMNDEMLAIEVFDAEEEEKGKENKNTVYSTTRGRLYRKKLMQEKSGRKW